MRGLLFDQLLPSSVRPSVRLLMQQLALLKTVAKAELKCSL